MMEYFQELFTSGRLFTMRPPAMQLKTVLILAGFFGLFVVLGIISKIITKKTNDGLKLKGWLRLFYLFTSMGLIGLGYLIFAWQGVTLLAARFWLIIWLITVIVWLIFIGIYMFSKVPKLRAKIKKQRNFEKYIP